MSIRSRSATLIIIWIDLKVSRDLVIKNAQKTKKLFRMALAGGWGRY